MVCLVQRKNKEIKMKMKYFSTLILQKKKRKNLLFWKKNLNKLSFPFLLLYPFHDYNSSVQTWCKLHYILKKVSISQTNRDLTACRIYIYNLLKRRTNQRGVAYTTVIEWGCALTVQSFNACRSLQSTNSNIYVCTDEILGHGPWLSKMQTDVKGSDWVDLRCKWNCTVIFMTIYDAPPNIMKSLAVIVLLKYV